MAKTQTDKNTLKMEQGILEDMQKYIAEHPATDAHPTLWERLLGRYRISTNKLGVAPNQWTAGEYNSIEALAAAAVFNAYGLGQPGADIDRLKDIASNVGMPRQLLLQELENQQHTSSTPRAMEQVEKELAEMRRQAQIIYTTTDSKEKKQAAGTLEQLKKHLIAYMADLDYSKTCGTVPQFTEKEKAALRQEILYIEGGMAMYNSLNAEWQGLRQYAHFVETYVVSPYLLEVAKLFIKIDKYKLLLEAVKYLNAAHLGQTFAQKMNTELAEKGIHCICPDEKPKDIPEQIICDPKTKYTPYKLRAKDEREIWADIKRQAKAVAKGMAEIKGCIDAANIYWLTGRLGIIPHYFYKETENIVNNTRERYMFNDSDKYYRGFLNDKIKDGYQPTPDEEKWALIPDYKEIKRDEKAYKIGKDKIAEIAEPAE